MHKLYQTIKVEHDQPVEGIVTGNIPEWVSGSLYRNGPGIYEVGEDKFNHLFDPLAMLQRFRIANKKVTYQSRYLRGNNYKRNMAAQRIVVYGFGTLPAPDPCKNVFQRFLSYFQFEETDNTLVNLFPYGEQLYSCTENQLINRIDRDTLEKVDQVNLSKEVTGLDRAPAHPHYDPDGTIHNVGYVYRAKGGPAICLFKIPPKSDPSQGFPAGQMVSCLRCDWKLSVNYLHSFAMTDHYYVYIEQPMFLNLLKATTILIRREAINKAIQYYPHINARFRIINKKTGKEVNPEMRYEAAAFFVFHHINAYEENDQIVIDLCAYKNDDILRYYYLKNLTSEQCEAAGRALDQPEPRRYVLPLNVNHEKWPVCVTLTRDYILLRSDEPLGNNLVTLQSMATGVLREDSVVFCTWETLAETGFEFPQISYSLYNGKKYRYAYGLGWHSTGTCFHTIVKIDTKTKTFSQWKEEKCYPSEPVFVSNPDGESEDDGVVLAAVNTSDFDDGKSAFLLVLDAKTMTEIARAEFNVQRFPKDFHGLFMPASN